MVVLVAAQEQIDRRGVLAGERDCQPARPDVKKEVHVFSFEQACPGGFFSDRSDIRRTMSGRAEVRPDRNLYLVGFMGTGKSTLGRLLAHRLGFQFLDSDQEIERRRGKRIREIFEEEGEEAFRREERAFILEGHPDSGCVVACGGGMVTQPGMVEILKGRGVVVCLYASPETILERTRGNSCRPLLDAEDPKEKIRMLMAEREPVYRRAGTLVLTDNRSRGEILAHIKRTYLREVRASGKGCG